MADKTDEHIEKWYEEERDSFKHQLDRDFNAVSVYVDEESIVDKNIIPIVKFYEKIDDAQLSFAVIISRMNGKWVLCKHKNRITFELPGGHRERGETISETALRELKEETGAVDFRVIPICYYSEQSATKNVIKYGALFFAEIFNIDKKLHSEIERIELFDEMPENLTYPEVTEKLIGKLKSFKCVGNNNGTFYFLVSDKSIKNLGEGKYCEFFDWLKSEGFKRAEISKGFWSGVNWIYININNKQYVAGMPGIKVVEPIGNHAITIDEFKTVFEIYKKYDGKSPLEF